MPDRPGHILEIPDSLGRDVDKAKAGKLKGALPVEAFMSDAALRQVEQQSSKAAVHAEDMIPISRAEASRRTTFSRDGSAVPIVPATRRVIPPPFRRPSINGGSHGKAWQVVKAAQAVTGDIVPDVGELITADERTVYAPREAVLAGSTLGQERIALPGNVLPFPPEDLDDWVAIGLVVLVEGKGGVVRAYRETDDIRVFRKAPEA